MKLIILLNGILLYFARANKECSDEQHLDESEKWQKILPEGYKQNAAPRQKNGPMELLIGVYPRGIPEMSIEKMFLEIDVYLIFTWRDCRLLFPVINKTTALPDEISSLLWHPKVYFGNGLGASPIKFTPSIIPMTVNIHEQLSYAVRRLIPFYCEFDLSSYPMDVQRCELQILSIERKQLVIIKELTLPQKEISLKGRTPPHFAVKSSKRGECKAQATQSTGSSCLALIFILERSVSYYLTVIYFPSMLIVSLTWVSFWLDIEASAPRVTLGLTSLLTLATQFANAQKSLPPVSYVKAVDVWMFACMVLVFASLVEFAIANYIHRRDSEGNPIQRPAFLNKFPIKNNFLQEGKIHPKTAENKRTSEPKSMKTNFIDGISRKIFPISFLFFNIAYWTYYLCFSNSDIETP